MTETRKCEAMKSNKGSGWSIVELPGDEKRYHRCNQPATIHANNPEYGNHGPAKVWLCAECDKMSATVTETRKDVGQLGKCAHASHYGPHVREGACFDWQPLPQPGETMEKRARGHAEQITWELGLHIKAETGQVLSQTTVTFFIDKIAAGLRLIEQETAQRYESKKSTWY